MDDVSAMKIFTQLLLFISSLFFLSCGPSDSSYFYDEGPTTTLIEGVVKHQVTDNVLADVNITINATPPINIITDANGEYNATLRKNSSFVLDFEKNGYSSTQYWLNTTSANEQTLETVYLVPDANGSASGIVTDASTSFPLEDVNLSLRIGINNLTGIVQASTLTLADGSYSFTNIASNTYTVHLTKSAYNEKFDSFIAPNTNQDYELDLTPNLAGDYNITGYVEDNGTTSAIFEASVSLRANSQTGPLLRTITTDINGFYAFENASNGTYAVLATDTGYSTDTKTVVVNSSHNNDNNLSIGFLGSGDLSGLTKDAGTGNAMDDVQIDVHEGTKTGPIVSTVTSSGGGNYTLTNLTVGDYVLELSKAGYITSYENETITIGQSVTKDYSLSTELGTNVMRIVLTWDLNPSDLDGRLNITKDDNTTEEITYSNTIVTDYASLDTDETGGYGPETITLQKFGIGKSIYYIRNYSSGTTPLVTAQNVSIKYYEQNGDITQVDMNASNGSGEYWEVMHITNGVVTIINELVTGAPTL